MPSLFGAYSLRYEINSRTSGGLAQTSVSAKLIALLDDLHLPGVLSRLSVPCAALEGASQTDKDSV